MGKQLGIVCTGGEGPHPYRLKQLIDDLSDKVMIAAADSGLLLAEEAGLKPDWIIGDMDSLGTLTFGGLPSVDGADRLHSYPEEMIIRHAADKDFTDTELAIALLREKGCDEVWIAGGGGGRIDHLLGIRDLFERREFPRRWITANEDIHCIAGMYIQCINNDSENLSRRIVSVFPLGDSPWKAESTGLKWPLDNIHWERGLYGLSNIATMPEITVNARQGRFLIILEGLWQRK